MGNKNYITLTEVDKIILESYKKVVLNLGKYLGNGYEIILHSLENLEHSIIENVNGHYSNRKNGGTITDLALSILNKIEKEGTYSQNYYINKIRNDLIIKSSTIPILGENNRIIGLICINFYTNISLMDFIHNFIQDVEFSSLNFNETKETFTENTDVLIETVLNEVKSNIINDLDIPYSCRNKEIIRQLYDKGIFKIKNSVIKVAKLLGISKNTVYLHIRNLK